MSIKTPLSDISGKILDEFRESLMHDEAFTRKEAEHLDALLRENKPLDNQQLDEVLSQTMK